MKNNFLIIGLVVIILFAFGGGSSENACEKSGGVYNQGFSETGGIYHFCECPIGKYSTNDRVCVPISSTETSKCQSLSTSYAECDISGNQCICNLNGVRVGQYPLNQLTSDKCTCLPCIEGRCNCICQG